MDKLPFNINPIEILKLGFSGFCFLMAFLSYLLLNKAQTNPNTNQNVLKSINKFLYFGLVFGVLVLLSSIIPILFSENDKTVQSLKNEIEEFDKILSEKKIEIAELRSNMNSYTKENSKLKFSIQKVKNNISKSTNSLTEAQYSLVNLISDFEDKNGPPIFIQMKGQIQPNGNPYRMGLGQPSMYGGVNFASGPGRLFVQISESMERNAKDIFQNLENAVLGNAKLDYLSYSSIHPEALIDELRVTLFPLRLRSKKVEIDLKILIRGQIMQTTLLGKGRKWSGYVPQTFFINLDDEISIDKLNLLEIKTKARFSTSNKEKSIKQKKEALMISVFGRAKGSELILLPTLFGLNENTMVSDSENELSFKYLTQ